MKLTALGIYGAYPQPRGGTSAYLLESGNTRVMLDFGAGALSRIQEIVPPEALDAVVLTHLHSDHMCDMLNLRYYLQLNDCKPLAVYLPQEDSLPYQMLAECPHFLLHPIEEGGAKIGELALRFYEMAHPVKTFGVRAVGKDGRVLAYSSDTRLCANLTPLIEGAHLFLADAAVLKAEERAASPHMAVRDAAELAAKAGVPMLLTHLTRSDAAPVLAEATGAGAKANVAREGKMYEV